MRATRIKLETYEQTYNHDLGKYEVVGEPLLVRFDCYIPTYGNPEDRHPTLHIYVSDPNTYDVVQHVEILLPAGAANLSTLSMRTLADTFAEEHIRTEIRSAYASVIAEKDRRIAELDKLVSATEPF